MYTASSSSSVRFKSVVQEYRSSGGYSTSGYSTAPSASGSYSSRSLGPPQYGNSYSYSSYSPPGAPLVQTRPLPPILDPSISSLDVDVSLPSQQFTHYLPHTSLQNPASNPTTAELQVVVPLGDSVQYISVRPRPNDPGYITVGRLLSEVHGYLRTASTAVTNNAAALRYWADLRKATLSIPQDKISAEKEACVKVVDHLSGNTRLRGFSVRSDGRWEMILEPARRYHGRSK
ncbi:hypothetical protein C8J56DRAFT_1053602 [Mycena floridula]|nr:hypothetical protein C8J56DRAFT_1053602 [Mycena floridula]